MRHKINASRHSAHLDAANLSGINTLGGITKVLALIQLLLFAFSAVGNNSVSLSSFPFLKEKEREDTKDRGEFSPMLSPSNYLSIPNSANSSAAPSPLLQLDNQAR